MEKQKLKVGDIVLRNNQFSAPKVPIQAKGIVLDQDFYVDLDSMIKAPVSKQEALIYSRRMNILLPTKKQMNIIKQNIAKINEILLSIGRGDCLLFDNICKDFWTRYDHRVNDKERRRVLFVVPIKM